jgi:hypothetical protein
MPDNTNNCGGLSADEELYMGDTIYNNTANTLAIDVVRVQDASNGWTTAFCLDVCYLPSKDSVHFTLQPNEHQGFILHFYTGATSDSTSALMKFKNSGTPSNSFLQRFKMSTLCLGVNEVAGNSANVNIYPMPVIANESFSINIATAKPAANMQLIIYNLFGSVVKTLNVKAGTTFLNLDLSSGVYSYNLVSENIKLNSGKIVVSK